jgi:hypothetical protein
MESLSLCSVLLTKGKIANFQLPHRLTYSLSYWPDGLHSPPSLEAMVYDLKALKEVGYNMVRKHVSQGAFFFEGIC